MPQYRGRYNQSGRYMGFYRSRVAKTIPAFDLTFTATGNGNVTPQVTFTGTASCWINGVENVMTSTTDHTFAVLTGQTIGYSFSNWDGVTEIRMNSDPISGDLGEVVWPIGLTYIQMNSTLVSGDMFANGMPGTLTTAHMFSTSLSGDYSRWTWPVNLATFTINTTAVDYDSTGGFYTGIATAATTINANNCGLTSTQVDNILIDCDAAGVTDTATINVAGTNAAPGPLGLIAANNLVSRGYTVTLTAGTLSLLTLTANATTNFTPAITFTGTVAVYIDGVYDSALTSGVAATIAVTSGEQIDMVFSSAAGVTTFNFNTEPVAGDFDQLAQFTNMTYLYLNTLSGATLTDAAISPLTSLTSLTLYTLGSLDLSTALENKVLLTTFNASNNSLNATAINAQLASLIICEAAGDAGRDCTVTLTGNNAAPTGQGLTDVTTLRDDKGWPMTVTV